MVWCHCLRVPLCLLARLSRRLTPFPMVMVLCTLVRVPWHLVQRVPPPLVSLCCPPPSVLTPGSPVLLNSLPTVVPVVWQLESLALRRVRHPPEHWVVPQLLNMGCAPVHRIIVFTSRDARERAVLALCSLLVSARK